MPCLETLLRFVQEAENYPIEELDIRCAIPQYEANQLINNGVPVMETDGVYWMGMPEDRARMLAREFNPLEVDNKGRNYLFYALNATTVNFFVEHGVPVNQSDSGHNNAIHFAHTPEVADALLRHGADIDSVNMIGSKPIHFARSLEMIQYFGGINTHDSYGFTLAHYLCSPELHTNVMDDPMNLTIPQIKQLLKQLIDLGLDITAQTNTNRTALHHTSSRELAEFLLWYIPPTDGLYVLPRSTIDLLHQEVQETKQQLVELRYALIKFHYLAQNTLHVIPQGSFALPVIPIDVLRHVLSFV